MTVMHSQDYGEYHCISKNEMGITRAVFHVQGKSFWEHFQRLEIIWVVKYNFSFSDRNPYIIRPLPEHTEVAVFGTMPPKKESLDDLCPPPPPPCPDCPDPKWVCQFFVTTKKIGYIYQYLFSISKIEAFCWVDNFIKT